MKGERENVYIKEKIMRKEKKKDNSQRNWLFF